MTLTHRRLRYSEAINTEYQQTVQNVGLMLASHQGFRLLLKVDQNKFYATQNLQKDHVVTTTPSSAVVRSSYEASTSYGLPVYKALTVWKIF